MHAAVEAPQQNAFFFQVHYGCVFIAVVGVCARTEWHRSRAGRHQPQCDDVPSLQIVYPQDLALDAGWMEVVSQLQDQCREEVEILARERGWRQQVAPVLPSFLVPSEWAGNT